MARAYPTDKGYLGEVPGSPTPDVMIIDNEAVKIYHIVVHSFTLGDVEDPDLYAGQPLWDWENSEVGRWVTEHAVETPMWHRHHDQTVYGTRYAITAKLKDADHTYFLMKYK